MEDYWKIGRLAEDRYGRFRVIGTGVNWNGNRYVTLKYDNPGVNRDTYQYFNKDGSFYQKYPDDTSLYFRAPGGWENYKASLPQVPMGERQEEGITRSPERMEMCEEDAHAVAILGLSLGNNAAHSLELLSYIYALFITSTAQMM